jgi:hypothetical protein
MILVSNRQVTVTLLSDVGSSPPYAHADIRTKREMDLAFLRATREYGCEVVEPGPTIERHGRKHIQFMKQLTGIVPPPGRRSATADEAQKRLHTQKTKFVARVRKAEKDW